jgi:hypothetical protein
MAEIDQLRPPYEDCYLSCYSPALLNLVVKSRESTWDPILLPTSQRGDT